MPKHKPKGKTPSLIGSTNGRPVKVDVKRSSECCRCGDVLKAGSLCIGIPKTDAFGTVRRFCPECFENVLQQTASDLEEAKGLLQG
jgi:hypothetical protein